MNTWRGADGSEWFEKSKLGFAVLRMERALFTGVRSLQNPIGNAVEVFRKLVRGRDADPIERDQRNGNAQVGRVEKMPPALADRGAQNIFRANRHRRRKHQRHQPFVGVEQHRNGQARDVRGQQKFYESA